MSEAASVQPAGSVYGRAEGRSLRALRAAVGGSRSTPVAGVLLGSALLALAGVVPIWGTRLQAPQYPKGLSLWFYGDHVAGPVREVNGLNHYIGMQPIRLDIVPELAAWPLAVIALGLALGVAVSFRGWIGRLALIGLWAAPFLILADIQRWLIVFGSELDPQSALRLKPFVPLVIGPNTVWNFTVWTYPGPALALIIAAAMVATVSRRSRRARPLAQSSASLAGLAIVVLGMALLTSPVESPAPTAPASSVPAATVDLQALVADAAPGSTVVVPPGTYRGHLVVDRTLTLVADGEAFLDGGGRGTVVTITAPEVILRGFRIGHTGGQVEEAAGIKVVGADRVTVEGNRLEDFFTGIAVHDAAAVRIIDNELTGSGQVTAGAEHAVTAGSPPPSADASSDPHALHTAGAGPSGQGDGISLWNVDGALVRGNRLRDVRDGVYLNYADEVLVDTNTIRSSRYALHAMFGEGVTVFGNRLEANLSGLVVMYTRGVTAGRNEITDHRSGGTGFGVILKDVVRLRLAENVLARNRVGLQVEGTAERPDAEAVVLHNRFAANGVAVSLMATADLSFGANAFDGNLTDVLALEPGVERRNLWSYHGSGNSWTAYAGYDLEGDGIGDVPHVAGGVAQAIIAARPELEHYRTSPALHVLAGAQGLWEAGRQPVVMDAHPLIEAIAPPAGVGRSAGPALAWQAAGALLLAPAAGGIRAARRRGRGRGR